jgi:hypothetical protein
MRGASAVRQRFMAASACRWLGKSVCAYCRRQSASKRAMIEDSAII